MAVTYNGYAAGAPAYLTTTTSNDPMNWIAGKRRPAW